MNSIKNDFPLFENQSHSFVYLDNAATTQKPRIVLDAMNRWYQYHNANVHRGIYQLAEHATTAYENARATVAHFINARPKELVFVSGATAGINTFAHAWALQQCTKGDEIVLTIAEHHANILPWQYVAQTTGAVLKYIPLNDHKNGFDVTTINSVITSKTKLVAFSLSSHAMPLDMGYHAIIAQAREVGATIFADAAQAVAHTQIDVKKIDVDALVFSAHKMYGPTGIGALYIHERLHNQLQPFMRGGGMITLVEQQQAQWQQMPQLLEAGTPLLAQAVGFAAACEYILTVGFAYIMQHEQKIMAYAIAQLQQLKHIMLLGKPSAQHHVLSFIIPGVHAHDVAALLDQAGICARAGNHCAQPLAQDLGYVGWIRVSIGMYTTQRDIDLLIDQLKNSSDI